MMDANDDTARGGKPFVFQIDPKLRTSGRFIGTVRRELQIAFLREEKRSGATFASIAEKIGASEEEVRQQFHGLANISLKRVGELAWALNCGPLFLLVEKSSNEVTAR